jgi:hypothetical protein
MRGFVGSDALQAIVNKIKFTIDIMKFLPHYGSIEFIWRVIGAN